jgi:hypothetical protein
MPTTRRISKKTTPIRWKKSEIDDSAGKPEISSLD